MIKQVKICDKCGEGQSRLYPFYKMRIECYDTKVDKVENSLCRRCLERFIDVQREWISSVEKENLNEN